MSRFLAWLVSLFTALTPVAGPALSPSPSPAFRQIGNYYYEQMIIADISRLQLNSNLADSRPAAELKQKNRCEFLTNAGFYDTANRHLGWFQINGQAINPPQDNNFLNGFLSISGQSATIGFKPDEMAIYGVQSGPVLIENNQALNLKIKDDQPRRRIVAALNESNQLIFLVILSQKSDYAGPLLADLPELIKKINPNLKAAINLDGGSASAFYSPAAALKEYSPIGGYFCYTE